MEIAELPGHPWYLAVQFHPEFKSQALTPHPLFADFVRASLDHRQARRGETAPAESVARLEVGVALATDGLWRVLSRGKGRSSSSRGPA